MQEIPRPPYSENTAVARLHTMCGQDLHQSYLGILLSCPVNREMRHCTTAVVQLANT